MWTDAFSPFLKDKNSLTGKFLSGGIPFRGGTKIASEDCAASVDAAIAIQAYDARRPTKIALVHTDATASTGMHTLLGIAFAKLVDCSLQPANKIGGGILFITQQISRTRQLLCNTHVRQTSIRDVFTITPLSQSKFQASWNTILLANPGRAILLSQEAGLSALILDATHPRTLAHLPAILNHPIIRQIPLQVIISPPSDTLPPILNPDGLLWFWDPDTVHEAAKLAQNGSPQYRAVSERGYWVANDDPLDAIFSNVEHLLSQAFRLAGSQSLIELREAWSIFLGLRSICVPLEQIELAWRMSGFQGRIKDRIQALRRRTLNPSGELRSFLTLNWELILSGLENAYAHLASRSEPGKYVALLAALDAALTESFGIIRPVTLTKEEIPLLAHELSTFDKGFSTALDEGMLEIVHQNEEARRIAGGRSLRTLLTGARPSKYRYLDVCPTFKLDVVCYPGEAAVDNHKTEERCARWQRLGSDERKRQIEANLRLNSRPDSTRKRWAFRSQIMTGIASNNSAPPINVDDVSLDVEWQRSIDSTVRHGNGWDLRQAEDRGRGLILTDIAGAAFYFSPMQRVNIYKPETEKLMSVSARDVRAGNFLVILLDDHLEDLFERLTSTIAIHRPLKDTLRLEKWRAAKDRLLLRFFGNRREIYRALGTRVTVDYGAAKAWFGSDWEDERECIGPQSERDFFALASLSKAYKDDGDMRETYATIQDERNNRRRLGRALHQTLKSLAGGHAFTQALKTAEALNTEVEDVLSAVGLHEIAGVSFEN